MADKTLALNAAADKLHTDYNENPSDDDSFKANTDRVADEATRCITDLYREIEALRRTIRDIGRGNRMEE